MITRVNYHVVLIPYTEILALNSAAYFITRLLQAFTDIEPRRPEDLADIRSTNGSIMMVTPGVYIKMR